MFFSDIFLNQSQGDPNRYERYRPRADRNSYWRAAGGAVSMVLGADATVPFGGVLMLPTMTRPWAGAVALLVNIVVTGITLALIKKNVTEEQVAAQAEVEEEEIDLDDIQIF